MGRGDQIRDGERNVGAVEGNGGWWERHKVWSGLGKGPFRK